MLNKLSRRWNRFFFTPDAAANLAICRILFYGGLLALHFHVDFAAWGEASAIFWMPIRSYEMLGIPQFSPGLLYWLSITWKIALLLSCLGLMTRVSALVSFVGSFFLLGLPHSMGDLSHGDAAAVLILGVLVFARSGDALSLDQVLWRRSHAPSGEYRWPVRAVWLILSTVFFAAGYAKFVRGGWEWAFSDNMAFILAEHQFPPEHPEAMLPWGTWMARQPWAYKGVGLATLLVETGYPLAMFSLAARFILVPAMVLSMIGFRVLLGPAFLPLILCHVFWIRWWPEPHIQRSEADDTSGLGRLGKPFCNRLAQSTRD